MYMKQSIKDSRYVLIFIYYQTTLWSSTVKSIISSTVDMSKQSWALYQFRKLNSCVSFVQN